MQRTYIDFKTIFYLLHQKGVFDYFAVNRN